MRVPHGSSLCCLLALAVTTAMPILARQRAVFYRERASNTYTSIAYSTAVLLAELPYTAIGVIFFQA